MRRFRHHIARFTLLLVSLQVLNMSIDAPDAEMKTGSINDADFNYIDTFVEYVAEVVLKIDNAIPESKDRQQKELQLHKQFQIAFQKMESTTPFIPARLLKKTYRSSVDKYAYQFIKEINPPPPKA